MTVRGGGVIRASFCASVFPVYCPRAGMHVANCSDWSSLPAFIFFLFFLSFWGFICCLLLHSRKPRRSYSLLSSNNVMIKAFIYGGGRERSYCLEVNQSPI